MTDTTAACPCGSGTAPEACCAPIIAGTAAAATAEALMRARYTAFVTGQLEGFLLDSLAPERHGEFDAAEVARSARDAQGLGFQVLASHLGGEGDSMGTVEYVASFRIAGREQIHHEKAGFRRDDQGRWLYADAEVNPRQAPRQVEKIGRNDPCPCGSGKKYKKCCGA